MTCLPRVTAASSLAASPIRSICGSPTKAAEIVTKYIITDLYAKAIQGMPAEAAVKWTYEEIAKVYV